MKTWKIGVVGARRGKTFIGLLQTMGEQAVLHAICEFNEENAAVAKEMAPANVKIYADYDEFLDSGLDAVILCDCFHTHASNAIKAMKKGIHVMSETTAAPTLGGCVELCRTVEQTKAKYMLGANVPFKKGIQFMRKQVEEGKLGHLVYGEAEYLHYNPNSKGYSDDNRHWRRMLPGPYYNMHSLGPLMYATNTMPKKVTAHAVYNDPHVKRTNKLTDHVGALSLVTMDNNAVFNVTGCSSYGPTSKWFRLIGDNGTMETQRYDEAKIIFASSGDEFIPGDPVPEIEVHEPEYSELGMPADVQCTEEQMRLGHNGIDFWLLVYFIKYLNGEHEPFFNVYRATALSAAAIMGWKSILNQSKEYIIPDFSNEEERKAYENDFLSPFEDEDSPNFISRKTNR